jgi:hypothetical protein
VPPVTFDGSADALLQPFAADGSAYMEYVRDRGVYPDLPPGLILEVFATAYPGFGTAEMTVDDPVFSALGLGPNWPIRRAKWADPRPRTPQARVEPR